MHNELMYGEVFVLHDHSWLHLAPVQEVDYHNIRLTSPQLLLCNGSPLSQDKLSSSVICVTAFS